MARVKFIALSILIICFVFLGCALGPSDKQIAASVEAQVAATAGVKINAPTNETINPSSIVDWSDGFSAPFTSYFEESYDEFDETILYVPNIVNDAVQENSNTLALFVIDNGQPELAWGARYYGDDWILMDGLKIRISETTYDLSDRFDYFDVNTDVAGSGEVLEHVSFRFFRKDLEMLERLLANPSGTVRLDGSDGNEDFQLTDDVISSWFAALALYQSLGGDLGN